MFSFTFSNGEAVIDSEKIFQIKVKEILSTYKRYNLDKIMLFINVLSLDK